MEAIVLAGGYGTRLQSVLKNAPKPMADIRGRPFLSFLFDYWIKEGVSKFHLLVSYRSDQIIKYYGEEYAGIPINYISEIKPMGTGGALKNAAHKINGNGPFLLLNGDTIFTLKLDKFLKSHEGKNSDLSIGLFKTSDSKRYDQVCLNEHQRIIEFSGASKELNFYANAGVYILGNNFLQEILKFNKEEFSFEKDYLVSRIKMNRFHGFIHDSYFIDIGVPDDYKSFQLIEKGFI